jgi:uncharacterized protein
MAATFARLRDLLSPLSRVVLQGDASMASAHVATLKSRHADLDARIHAEEQRPAPDGTMLAKLKKLKLRVKEELARAR